MHREELSDLVRPILEEEGYELVECSVSRTSRHQTFRLAIDGEDGVPVEACARVSRRIADLLDGNPMLRGIYQLEVSSPGMNRPIWRPDHFRRFRGERVRLELAGSGDGPPTLVRGEIGGLEEDGVHLLVPGGEDRLIRFEEIANARVQIDPWRRRGAETGAPGGARDDRAGKSGATHGPKTRAKRGERAESTAHGRHGTRDHGNHGD